MSKQVFFSALLPQRFPEEAAAIFAALGKHHVPYRLLEGTKDIWLRDFMPVRENGAVRQMVSFRYAPSYLAENPELRTDMKTVAPQLEEPVKHFSVISLDVGNMVFVECGDGPRAIISDRPMVANLGVNVNQMFSILFMIGIGIAGLGGVLNAPVTGQSPKEGLSVFGNVMPILVIGGLRNMRTVDEIRQLWYNRKIGGSRKAACSGRSLRI